MKFIHAHQIPKNTSGKPRMASVAWPSSSPWWSPSAAWATATTKVRSKNSSSGVADRCDCAGSRPAMRA